MSTRRNESPGGKVEAGALIEQSKALVDAAAAEEQQLSMLEPVTPEEMAIAREELGGEAGRLTVLRHARATRRGRPAGVKNRRTEDFRKYILGFGQDPAITLMQIQNTDPEILVERSAEMDPVKRRMSYGDAQQLRVRCAEALMPFIHSKQPVAVDMNFSGLSDLVIAGVTHSEAQVQDIIEGDFMPLDDDGDEA
ncbi:MULTISPECIES: hypothetical protein [unclassified Novosphingobium]|uniref:hypothetical protein n=1 Tax=unclassified Novosphingobium TaxID=2644732 RepID=UPI000D2FD69D|nr:MULTISPECIES: hypothetical protein [unclassified Novosphingobium]PTR07878.1 hypothetical protein C8K11_11389 [Novosphingobium sp. GV055]PUB00691.1 hypothetical protein C8K12_11389 [Novosphingobium sp. GV061]PUB16100.1 hypothetical protein C8K14_11389 [Novosphingobium sp. GV079]PUB39565.1 hypothetical protein C8K10_11389 [Novosphingobium sp. GV027]